MRKNYIGKFESKFLFLLEQNEYLNIIDNDNNCIGSINYKEISSQYNISLIANCYILNRIYFIF